MKVDKGNIEGHAILRTQVVSFVVLAVHRKGMPRIPVLGVIHKTGRHTCPSCNAHWSEQEESYVALAMGPDGIKFICQACAQILIANGVAEASDGARQMSERKML